MGLQVPLLAQEQSWAQSCPKCPPAHTVDTGQPGTCPLTCNPQTTTHPQLQPQRFPGHSHGRRGVTDPGGNSPPHHPHLPSPFAHK